MENSDSKHRWQLALAIVALGIVGISVISFVVIHNAESGHKAETSRLVFSSILPLLGTWVGTVLAFYFARDNFEAAAKGTIELLKTTQQSSSEPVTSVMIPASEMLALDLGAHDDPAATRLADLYKRMAGANPVRHRLPIRDASGRVLYVVHDSTLLAYAQSVGETPDATAKTLGDLMGVSQFKVLVEAIGFVREEATIAEARAAMASVKSCNDVFVTAHGKGEEPALGWVTNTLLASVE